VNKSPKSYALQAVGEDVYPIGGFPRITASAGGGKSGDYNAMETICNHDSKYVETLDAKDTIRTPKKCPKDGLGSNLHVSV